MISHARLACPQEIFQALLHVPHPLRDATADPHPAGAHALHLGPSAGSADVLSSDTAAAAMRHQSAAKPGNNLAVDLVSATMGSTVGRRGQSPAEGGEGESPQPTSQLQSLRQHFEYHQQRMAVRHGAALVVNSSAPFTAPGTPSPVSRAALPPPQLDFDTAADSPARNGEDIRSSERLDAGQVHLPATGGSGERILPFVSPSSRGVPDAFIPLRQVGHSGGRRRTGGARHLFNPFAAVATAAAAIAAAEEDESLPRSSLSQVTPPHSLHSPSVSSEQQQQQSPGSGINVDSTISLPDPAQPEASPEASGQQMTFCSSGKTDSGVRASAAVSSLVSGAVRQRSQHQRSPQTPPPPPPPPSLQTEVPADAVDNGSVQ